MRAILQFATCTLCDQHFVVRDFRDVLKGRGQRVPLVLHCGHAACEKCIRSTLLEKKAKYVVCGECQSVSPYSGDGKDLHTAFPLHLYLLGHFILRSAESSEEPQLIFQPVKGLAQQESSQESFVKKVLCSECEKTSATCNCKQCAAAFCDGCFTSVHNAAKALKSHERESLEAALMRCEVSMCKTHIKHELDMYCESCKQVICVKCSVLFHNGHTIVPCSKVNESLLPELEVSLECAKQRRLRIKQTLKEVQQLACEPKGQGIDELCKVEQELVKQMIFIHGRLQRKEANLMMELAEKATETESRLHSFHSQLSTSLSKLEAAMRTAQIAVLPSNLDKSDVEAVKVILDQATNVPSHLVHSEPSAENNLHITMNPDLMNVIDDLINLKISHTEEYCLVSDDQLPAHHSVCPLTENEEDISLFSGVAESSTSLKDTENPIISSMPTSKPDNSMSSSSSTSSLSNVYIPAGMTSKSNRLSVAQEMDDPFKDLKIGSSVFVFVSHIVSPSEIYVHTQHSYRLLEKLSKTLKTKAKKQGNVTSIKKNELYLVKFPGDGDWYRGKVIDIPAKKVGSMSEMLYKVYYVDYGNCESIGASWIKKLPHEYVFAPSQVIVCSLSGLKPNTGLWEQSAIVELTKLLHNPSVLLMHILGSTEDRILVDFTQVHTIPEREQVSSVRDAMLYLGHGSFADVSNPIGQEKVSTLNRKFLKQTDIGVNQDFEANLTHVDSPSSFFFNRHLPDTYKLGQELHSDMSSQKDTFIWNPYVGMPCAAKFSEDGKWYRALILKVFPPQKVFVLFVDFGNKEEVSAENLKYLPEHFLRKPQLAIHCCLADVKPNSGDSSEWTDDAISILKSYLLKNVTVCISSLKNDKFEVCLYSAGEDCDKFVDINKLVQSAEFKKNTEERSLCLDQERNGDITICEKGLMVIPKEGSEIESPETISVSDQVTTILEERMPNLQAEKAIYHITNQENPVEEVFKDVSCQLYANILCVDSNPLIIQEEEDLCNPPTKSSPPKVDLSRPEIPPCDSSYKALKSTSCGESPFTSISVEEVPENKRSASKKSSGLKTLHAKSVQHRLKQAQQNFSGTSNTSVKVPVEVLVAESPSCLYLRLTSQTEKITRLCNEMSSFYEGKGMKNESVEWKPEVKGRCAVKVDHMWFRALVLEILPESKFKVMLKDIGRVEVVEKQFLRKLADDFLSVRDGAIKCHLADIKAAGACREGDKPVWSTLACEQLKNLVGNHRSNLFISKKGEICVKERSLPILLWVREAVSTALEPTVERWFTINRILVNEGAALPDRPLAFAEEDAEINAEDMNILSPPDDPDGNVLDWLTLTDQESSLSELSSEDEDDPNTKIDDWLPSEDFQLKHFEGMPTYVDYDCNVFIHDLKKSARILKFVNSRLNKKYLGSVPQAQDNFWFVGQLCIAKYHLDDNWYRGKVVKVDENNVIDVLLVDYGNKEDCHSRDLRKEIFFKTTPILARKCRIEGLIPSSDDGKWSIEALDSVHKLLVGNKCDVTVLRKPTADDDVHLVDIVLSNGQNIKEVLGENEVARYIPINSAPRFDVCSDDECMTDEPDVVIIEESRNAENCSECNSANEMETQKIVFCDVKETDLNRERLPSEPGAAVPSSEGWKIFESSGPLNDLGIVEESKVRFCPSPYYESFSSYSSADDGNGAVSEVKQVSQYLPACVPQCNVWLVSVVSILSATEVFLHITSIPSEPEFDEMLEFFEVMYDDMQKEAALLPLVKEVALESPCCACYEGIWYRGLVEAVHGDKVTVKLVDGGNYCTISLNDLRDIRPDWLKVPLRGFDCVLSGLIAPKDSNVDEVCQRLSSCVFDKPLKAVVKKRQPFEVVLFSVSPDEELAYEDLIREGLLIDEEQKG